MKVNIGPFTSWFGPYQLAKLIMFWVPEEKDEYGFPCTPDRVHRFGEWLAHGSIKPDPEIGELVSMDEPRHTTWLYKLLARIDAKKKRKVQVRIDKWDVWSMDDTLAHIILPMLKQLKVRKQGSPMVEDEDVPEHLRSTAAPAPEEHDIDANYHARWEYVLDEMIFAFENKLDDSWEKQFESGNHSWATKIIDDKGTSELIKTDKHTFTIDWEGRKAYANRITRGFALFGKYYEGLWV